VSSSDFEDNGCLILLQGRLLSKQMTSSYGCWSRRKFSARSVVHSAEPNKQARVAFRHLFSC